MGCQTPYGWMVDPFCMLAPALEELQDGHPRARVAKEGYLRRASLIREAFWDMDRQESVYRGRAWGSLDP